MIKWEELTSIDLIPKGGEPVLVCQRILQLYEIIVFNMDHPDENSYVIYLDRREWFSAKEILDRYSHFCLINQPERSKRENSMHKYYYDLFDCSKEKASDRYQGRVYSKEQAESWRSEFPLRTHHEKLLCQLTNEKCSDQCKNYNIDKTCEMRCSEHCGNTVREAQ